jgi:hypothetical protein
MNLQESIRRILREEYIPTETEYLGWYIPRKLYDELENIGIKIWDKENDKVYIAEFQFDTKSVVFEILDFTGESYFNSLFPIPLSYKSYHTKKIKDLPKSIKYFIRRRFEQEWVNIMDKYDDDGKIIQENIRKILREEVFESDESRQERKFTKLLNNIEEYINSNSYNSVIRVMVDYDEVMDDVIVNIFFDAEKARELGGGINSVIKRSGKKIMEDLSVFPFDFKYHIHFEKPQLNESRTNSSLNNLLNMLFDGFDDIHYDWANYMCGMGECCDPYAIGFTLPKNDYDDYIFKLVDGNKYDDDGDYPKEFRDELPEVCYEQPNLKNPDFDTIVFYGLYAEEIEDYMGPESNWRSDLLKLINKKFGCEAKQIIII